MLMDVRGKMTYVFRESIPFPCINPLQPNRPLLPDPGPHPLRIRLSSSSADANLKHSEK